MGSGPLIIVEHMEEKTTRWLVQEYVEAYEAVKRYGLEFLVANAWDPVLQAMLSRYGVPFVQEPVARLRCPQPVIVLDMRAEKRLEPWEASTARCIVIGGIMGDHPPRGRGLLLVYSLPGSSVRHLGSSQLSIHTAALVASRVASGENLDSIRLAGPGKVVLRTALGDIEVELPYAYPVGPDGRPEVPERVRRVLERGVMWDEL